MSTCLKTELKKFKKEKQKKTKAGAAKLCRYLAEVWILPLLEVGARGSGAQLHVAQNDGEGGVVNGAGKVHVQLVHRCLQFKA